MKELKFHKESEFTRLENPNKDNIYSGRYNFSTQTTAVYDTYCLIETPEKILKINVACEKAFAKGDQIAILNDGRLRIFKNKKLIKTLQISSSDNLKDFVVESQDDLEKINDSTSIFLIGEEEMAISARKIEYAGRQYNNEIHEPHCEYFVAYDDSFIVVGNSQSFNFIYFYKGELAEVDEYSPLSVRTDEESLESVPLCDIKFWNGKLLLIDETTGNVFSISEIKLPRKIDKEIVEYEIAGDAIKPINASNTESGKFLDLGPEFLPSNHPSFIASDAIQKDNIKSDTKGKFESEAESDAFSTYKSSLKFPSIEHQPKFVSSTSESNAKDAMPDRKEEELEELDARFTQRIDEVKASFSKLQKKKSKSKCLLFPFTKFDVEGLYNLIFHNSVCDYEDALSNMIFQVENIHSASENNVLENIKLFDSKIFEKKAFKRPVRYTAPLFLKFDACLNIADPFDDLLEGIRVLNVKEDKTDMKFEQKSSGKTNGTGSVATSPFSLLATPVVKSHTDLFQKSVPDVVQDQSQSKMIENRPSLDVSKISEPLRTNPSISLPFGATASESQQPNPTQSIFGHTPPKNLFVQDTSSLFSNITSGTPNVPFQQDPGNEISNPPQKSNSGDAPVSAFNRLAGSRRLFK